MRTKTIGRRMRQTASLHCVVAEISKNWINGGEAFPGSGTLSQQFERAIEFNRARGYALKSFTLHRLMTGPDQLNETIIAVFKHTRQREERT